ncbi:hypothetical protein KK120_05630 [Virgibacillus dakarensis]|uniref:hypothetical protein n=1 Tax=Virgibacillus dakarensis TaxID=1917889 RepID=UPI000B452488|nr:hypothetical protein [Virgibacillus dakarensis]MBT2215305.1 hypothetical protein [Virgibacillus dakarensis]
MRVRYIFLICFFSLLINIASMYNIFFGICSLFLILLVVIPQLIVKTVNRAKRKDSERSFAVRNLAEYGSQKITRSMNKFSILFSLAVIYCAAAAFIFIQINRKDAVRAFMINHFQFGKITLIAQTLSILGYILFIVSLALVTLNSIRLVRNEEIFAGK